VLITNDALGALAPDATVILMATCPPERVRDIAKRVEATGRTFVDAPVSGGIAGATAGTLTIMVGAASAVFSKSKPVLEAMGSKIYHLGEEPGQGAVMKTINQLLCGVHIATAAEALALAERAGVDPTLAHQILSRRRKRWRWPSAPESIQRSRTKFCQAPQRRAGCFRTADRG